MANAARDPVFWAGVAIAHQDDAEGTEDCIRCHAPRAFLQGRGQAIAIDELEPADLEGVTCDLCHRMQDDGMTPPGNARYVIDDESDTNTVPKRGPWTYAADDEMPHAWIQDPYLGESSFCGVCHDVTTSKERVDEQGNGLGIPFGEQRTYSEWVNSAFADAQGEFRSCQDCHMPALDNVAGCSMWAGVQTHPSGGRRHDLVGANRFVLELLRDLYGESGEGIIADVYFDHSIERTDELLSTAASLSVQAPAQIDAATGLHLAVTVTNHTGHKLPTGYSEGRVMWLEVVARYGDEILWESGRWLGDGTFQHDDQVRTYEGIAEDHADGTRLHLLRNDRWVTDTRIPPQGLRPDIETDPVGDRYQLQPDGTWPHVDQVTYDFAGQDNVADTTPNDENDDQLELSVRLLYLINTAEYIDFLATANQTNEAGTELAALFSARGGATPVVLAEHTESIPLRGLGAGDGDTGDTGSTGNTDTTNTGPTSDGADGDSSATDSGDSTGDTGSKPASAGCSCATGSGGTGLLLLGLVPLGLRRRRRHPFTL